jgi:hypothetical protein
MRRPPPPHYAPLLAACAVLLLAIGASPAQAAEQALGRLFHTPEQRRQLDQMRHSGASRPEVGERPALRLDGVVRHPDGRVTTWINGRPAPAGRGAQGPGPARARVSTGTGQTVELRVGDALPAGDSAPQSLLGDGRVRRDGAEPPRKR